MFFATAWDRPDVPGLVCPPPEETHVQQHFKDECDIHNILKRIEHGADPAILQERKALYADLTTLPVASLAQAYDAVAVAEDAFMALPSSVRSKFGNDAFAFAEFVDSAESSEVAALFEEKAPVATDAMQARSADEGEAPSAQSETP